MATLKRTPLYSTHAQLTAKIGEFGGWEMPLWYPTGQIKEHLATRNQCGIFDICHMGEFLITGKNSLAFWEKILTNEVTKLKNYQAQYNFMLNNNGGVIDDCIVYRFSEDKWMLVVNAGTIDKDFQWLRDHQIPDMHIENISDQTAKIDLQGPTAPKVIAKLIGKENLESYKFFRFQEQVEILGIPTILSRTGYTGEIGFELYFPIEQAKEMWDGLMDAGKNFGITPVGLAARDTLRLEAGLPLNGHELSETRVALGHPWMFSIKNEHNFIGKDKLAKAEEEGRVKYIQGFKIDGKFKALPDYQVFLEDANVGEVVSGVIAPSLNNTPIGFALLEEKCRLETSLAFVSKDNKRVLKGTICEMPLLEMTSRRKITDFL